MAQTTLKFLVGNTCDHESKKVVSIDETRVFADHLNIRLLKASAKSEHQVEETLFVSQGGNYRSSLCNQSPFSADSSRKQIKMCS